MTQQSLAPLRRTAAVLSEAPGNLSRENVSVLLAGSGIGAGTVLASNGGVGAASFAMAVGATGNPTASTIVLGAGAVPGTYFLEFMSATAFQLEGPQGVTIGTGKIGTLFDKGGLKFTLTAGSNAAAVGDAAWITVGQGAKVYSPYQANGAVGPAVAVLCNAIDAATGIKKGVAVTYKAEMNRFEATGLDAAAERDLQKVGIHFRGTAGLPAVSTPAL